MGNPAEFFNGRIRVRLTSLDDEARKPMEGRWKQLLLSCERGPRVPWAWNFTNPRCSAADAH